MKRTSNELNYFLVHSQKTEILEKTRRKNVIAFDPGTSSDLKNRGLETWDSWPVDYPLGSLPHLHCHVALGSG